MSPAPRLIEPRQARGLDYYALNNATPLFHFSPEICKRKIAVLDPHGAFETVKTQNRQV